ncbi:MAG: DUF4149 domain-containing protein [Myxococcota bacterium]|nr:DUF4149 domain-containing protein [Myxococcota bacterium]
MHDVSLIFIWLVVGAKLTFAAVIAPTVFQTLAPDAAGQLLRAVFPRLYILCASLSGVSALVFAVLGQFVPAALMAAMVVIYLYSRGPLTTQINTARDAELAGDTAAKDRFDRLHKLSVRIFSMQLLGLVGVAVYWQA